MTCERPRISPPNTFFSLWALVFCRATVSVVTVLSRSVPTAHSHTHTHTHTGVFTLSSLSLDTQAEASASSTPLSQLSLQNGPDPGLVHFLDGPTVAVTPAAHAGSASALRVAGVGGRQSPRVREGMQWQ